MLAFLFLTGSLELLFLWFHTTLENHASIMCVYYYILYNIHTDTNVSMYVYKVYTQYIHAHIYTHHICHYTYVCVYVDVSVYIMCMCVERKKDNYISMP